MKWKREGELWKRILLPNDNGSVHTVQIAVQKTGFEENPL
jgi:hypothetical protein